MIRFYTESVSCFTAGHLDDGDGQEGDGEEGDPEEVRAEDHARDVGEDEEEGGHQPRQDQPPGVLSRAVHQHHAAARGQDTHR